MKKRRIACACFIMTCLFVFLGCSGKNLSGTEWTVAGSVDSLGNEQPAVAGGTYSTLALAFQDKKAGTLRMEGVNYPFTYEADDDALKATMQDGSVARIRVDGKKIYLTIGDMTLFFNKK